MPSGDVIKGFFGRGCDPSPGLPTAESEPLRKLVQVHIHRHQDRFIVAGMSLDGFYYGVEGRVHVGEYSDKSELGRLIREEFIKCEHRVSPIEWKNRKKSDWPAFRASRIRSMAQFGREFVSYDILGLNVGNISAQIESESIRDGVRLMAIANPLDPGRIAFRLSCVHKLFLRWEKI